MRVQGKFSIQDAWDATGSVSWTLAQVRGDPPIVEPHLHLRVRRHPFRQKGLDRRVAAMAVHDQDTLEALFGQTVQHVADQPQQRVDLERNRTGICAKAGHDAVDQPRKHRHAQRVRRLQRDPGGQDDIGRQAQAGMLFGAADRQNGPIVAAQVAFDLAPVHVGDAHRLGVSLQAVSARARNGRLSSMR